MLSATNHIPKKLLSKIDELVREKGISRNRFIVDACEQAFKNSGVDGRIVFSNPISASPI